MTHGTASSEDPAFPRLAAEPGQEGEASPVQDTLGALAKANEELEFRLQDQAVRLRRANEDREAALDEVRELRRKSVQLSVENARLRETFSYRLGEALLRALTWRGLVALPKELWALWRDPRRNSRGREADAVAARSQAGERAKAIAGVLDYGRDARANTVAAELERLQVDPKAAAHMLADTAKSIRGADLARSIEFGREAARLDPSAPLLRLLAGLTYDAGMVEEPAKLLERAGELAPHPPKIAVRARVVHGLQAILRDGLTIPARRARGHSVIPRKVLYLAASSLPHHISGYTIRTQNVVGALRDAGWNAEVFTRPGYPWDRPDARQVDSRALESVVDRLVYRRLRGPSSTETPLDLYIAEAAATLTAELRAGGHSIVHAASNYVNALPALIAARRLGLPFVYEVRGLWELTSVSKGLGDEHSERFRLMRDLETLTASEADAVMVLTEGLKQELVERGVDARRIALAPNCVDVEGYRPSRPDLPLAEELGLVGRFVIGFIGSFVSYEGLEDLVDAVGELATRGDDAVLLLVGDGPSTGSILHHADDIGVRDRVVHVGRVPPDRVAAYYSIIDVAAFPRRPERVCEIVSPLKPLEAFAMGKPVVASSVAALAEMVDDGVTGLLFEKGDTGALADALAKLIADPELARAMGSAGRSFVEHDRTWAGLAHRMGIVYEGLFAHR